MKAHLLAALVLAGCAAPPAYQSFITEIDGARPTVSRQQAIAVCVPAAELAGQNARAASRASMASPGAQPNYLCSPIGTDFTCAPSSGDAMASALAGIGDAIVIDADAARAKAAYLGSCLARYGYRYFQRCVANCS